jgi:hypothetical protein
MAVVVGSGADGLDGLLVWAVPTLALTVPGLLLLAAIAAQVAGAVVWLPVVRRKLGSPAEAMQPRPGGDRRPVRRSEAPRPHRENGSSPSSGDAYL